MLVLEDLHWADEATLDVLALLAARIAQLLRCCLRAIGTTSSTARTSFGCCWESWCAGPGG